jgi:hypothetical protein
MLNQRRKKEGGSQLNSSSIREYIYKYLPHHQDRALGRGIPGVREDVCNACGVVFEGLKHKYTSKGALTDKS